MIQLDRLREVLRYDPETGHFFWTKCHKRHQYLVGHRAGTTNHKGYVMIKIDGCLYQAHRLAWFYFYGEEPINHIDHMNGKTEDNRIKNLRDVDRSTNQLNRKPYMRID